MSMLELRGRNPAGGRFDIAFDGRKVVRLFVSMCHWDYLEFGISLKQGKGGGVEKRGVNKEPLISPLLNKNSIANKGGKERELEKSN
jgi:hypothetical protein